MHHQNKYRLKRNIYVPWEILESAAFKQLSARGIWVLLKFMQKRTWHQKSRKKEREYCNSGLVFTYDEARTCGISKSQYHTIVKRLVQVGFLDIEHQGGIFGKDYSRYAISERWRDYGTERFRNIEKKRIVLPGRDVHSRKLKIVTKTRNNVITEIRNSNGNQEDSGYRKTVTIIDSANQAETTAKRGIELDQPL